MRKRLILTTVTVAAVACVVLGTLAMWPPRKSVMEAKFDRIENGMTLEEVELVLGRRADIPISNKTGSLMHGSYIWSDDGVEISISFMNTPFVHQKSWDDTPKTIPQKIRRWLHLR
jgi:hypothetical protein